MGSTIKINDIGEGIKEKRGEINEGSVSSVKRRDEDRILDLHKRL